MICPLIWLGNITRFSQKADPAECIKDECAWWDDEGGACCISSLMAFCHQLRQLTLVATRIKTPNK